MLAKMKHTYHEFPRHFWVLVGAAFIDRLGGGLVFPFFAVYITQRFGVGMTQVGQLFALFSVTGMIGGTLGGAMADKFGRKKMMIFGLVFSAITMLLFGLVDSLALLFLVSGTVGLLADTGFPAHHAMVADLLPEEKRAEGFGIMRVVANLAITIGPLIGGLIATRSFMALFILDAITSTIMAIIVFVKLPETKPQAAPEMEKQSLLETISGYRKVLKDGLFLSFIGAQMLMVIVYIQMNSTLPVYMNSVLGMAPTAYGTLLSMNAGMVVLFQFWITHRIKNFRPMAVMAAGTLLYAIGFSMFGFTSAYGLFILAIVIITIGEMLVSPVSQALVAEFAPEDMRGRYIAMNDFCWIIPHAIGPLGAGLLMDNASPLWVWKIAGMIALGAVVSFLLLNSGMERRRRKNKTRVEHTPLGSAVAETV
jgi:MFS family permease